MNFILKINGSDSHTAAFIGWTPVKCTLTVDSYIGLESMPVIVNAGHTNKNGRIALYPHNGTGSQPLDEMEHDFQIQPELTFYIAGVFGHASAGEKDTYIKVVLKNPNDHKINALQRDIMVRVRKNANELSAKEIELFLRSFAAVSFLQSRNEYKGEFTVTPSTLLHEIVLMHTFDTQREIHNRDSFHPWHRLYLMHLERELQSIDPHVTVPYWKFDEGAENVFAPTFLGKTKKANDPDLGIGDMVRPELDPQNPLYYYKENTAWGPLRRAYWDTDPAVGKSNPSILNEAIILGYSGDFSDWHSFEEGKSHNQAHNAFIGHVVDIGKDPVDPLFFMMHANVDRLWAKWQHVYNRFDSSDVKTYGVQGKYNGLQGDKWAEANVEKFQWNDGFFAVDDKDEGNFVNDTLWPWDFDEKLSRPWRKWANGSYGCGNVPYLAISFPQSLCSNYPQGPITVGSTIDYQSRIKNDIILGFDYDDLPYFEKDKISFDKPQTSIVQDTQTFLNQSIPNSERLGAANSAVLFTKADHDKSFEILKNKLEDGAIRLKTVQLLDERRDQFLIVALDIMADETEDVELRYALVQKMVLAKRSNIKFHTEKPRFLNILRGLLKSRHAKLRNQAIDILSSYGDFAVQDLLVEEIKKDQSRVISKEDAIFFLRQSAKNQHVKLFRELANSNESVNVKAAAIKGLSTDQDSLNLLENLVINKAQDSKIREAGIQSLFNLNKERLVSLAPQVLTESRDSEGIALFSRVDPDPGEVDLKIGLLNFLTYSVDAKQLATNWDLRKALKELIKTDERSKSNFRSSIETVANMNDTASPSIIEQMVFKLLDKLK